MSKHVELGNARDPEQLARMQRHSNEGRCHFCPEGFAEHTSPISRNGIYWFITRNDFPYTGSVYHYLIVSKRHIASIIDLELDEIRELYFDMLLWLQSHLGVTGFSLFVRNGDMAYTGATLSHLHFHFVVGVKKETESHPIIVGPLGYKKK